jgi:hypothetical protein
MKVRVQPIHGAEPMMCNHNVQKRIEALGGNAVYGWLTKPASNGWQVKENHCVWESPGGELQDVTPRFANVQGEMAAVEWEDAVEFDRDDGAAFHNGKAKPPVYVPPRDDPRLRRAAEYISRGDWLLMNQDLEGCRYWTNRANREVAKAGERWSWNVPESLDIADVLKSLDIKKEGGDQ